MIEPPEGCRSTWDDLARYIVDLERRCALLAEYHRRTRLFWTTDHDPIMKTMRTTTASSVAKELGLEGKAQCHERS